MKKIMHIVRIALVVFVIYGMCLATPQNNYFDTQPIYTVYGLDKYFKEKDKGEIRFHLSPFYQQGSTARNNDGAKVAAGDRLGAWNLFGVFYEMNGMPTGKTLASFTNLSVAATAVAATTGLAQEQPPVDTSNSRYRVPIVGVAASPGVGAPNNNLTNESKFQPEKHTFAYVSRPLNYEKIGLRSQLNFDFGFGLGVSVKGGIVDVKQKPSTFVLEPRFQSDYLQEETTQPAPQGERVSTVNDRADAKDLYNSFYAPSKFNLIAKDLEIDLSPYHKSSFEDMLLQLYWHFPIDLDDRNGDVVATMVPYISVGSWLPISEERDVTKPFSVAIGNDGYYGLIAEASLAFDFPVVPQDPNADLKTFQICFGGGIVGFNSRTQKNVRMYTSDYQSGFVPWKAIVSRRPGLLWYLNTSMKAENFIDGLSVYLDYAYTQHMRDDVTLLESGTRKTAFDRGLERYVRETSWKNQQVNVGFDYKVAEALSIGGAVQGHISGVRVYRATTLMGGLTLKL